MLITVGNGFYQLAACASFGLQTPTRVPDCHAPERLAHDGHASRTGFRWLASVLRGLCALEKQLS
ncbi:MAG TPA: hypothetical protein VHZ74_16545 [Bryobacteraceae bacterium]|nr:hypothetical protein [Bryobacteraceae bacterium]